MKSLRSENRGENSLVKNLAPKTMDGDGERGSSSLSDAVLVGENV